MIISGIIKDALNGLQLTYNDYNHYHEIVGQKTSNVTFGYGDSNELSRFIASRTNLESFPLIWYVKPNYKRDNVTNKFRVNAKFVIMMSTNAEYYNEERALINYANVIEPLTRKFIDVLKKQRNISIVSQDIDEFDDPQYGLDVYNNSDQQTKSATLLYTDARAVELELLIKVKCQN